ncbi:MAG: PilZ domain-containing protein [Nitrospirota bacterium]
MSKRGTSNPRRRPTNPSVVEYLGQNFTGKGTMTDLSVEGMKILGTHPVHTGMRLALQLLISEPGIPIQIPCAYVRWTRGLAFGVRFGPMELAITAQIQSFLSSIQGSPIA